MLWLSKFDKNLSELIAGKFLLIFVYAQHQATSEIKSDLLSYNNHCANFELVAVWDYYASIV